MEIFGRRANITSLLAPQGDQRGGALERSALRLSSDKQILTAECFLPSENQKLRWMLYQSSGGAENRAYSDMPHDVIS